MRLEKGLTIVQQHDLTTCAGIQSMRRFRTTFSDKGLNSFLPNRFEIEMNGSLNV